MLVLVRWWHSTFVEPPVTWWLDTVLGAWEESWWAGRAGGPACLCTTRATFRLPSADFLPPHSCVGLRACKAPCRRRPAQRGAQRSSPRKHETSRIYCLLRACSKVFVREAFATTTRLINGASAWVRACVSSGFLALACMLGGDLAKDSSSIAPAHGCMRGCASGLLALAQPPVAAGGGSCSCKAQQAQQAGPAQQRAVQPAP